jgi:hypothetical protein
MFEKLVSSEETDSQLKLVSGATLLLIPISKNDRQKFLIIQTIYIS